MPLDRPIDRVLSRLGDYKRQGKGYRAHCPAHDDKHPSLDVTEGTDGTVLVKCQSQRCSFDNIVSALEMDKSDFFPSRNGSRFTKEDAEAALTNRGLRPETIRYFKVTANIEKQAWEFPLGKDARTKYKAFSTEAKRRYWVNPGTKHRLYHLAPCTGKSEAWLCEGEPDVWVAHQADLVAFTFTGGAENVLQSRHVEEIKAAKIGTIHVVYDLDGPGRQGAAKVAAAFAKAAIRHTVRQLPETVSDKGDVTTLYNMLDRDDEEFRRVMQTLPEVVDEPPTSAESPTDGDDEGVLTSARCTDVGNARRFIAQHGTEVRYCHTWRKWLEWDGTRWAIDDTGAIARRAKATLDVLFHAAAGLEDDERQRLIKHALASERGARLEAMLRLAESDERAAITASVLDTDPWKLNILNGTLDLRTGELLPHDPNQMHSKLAPVSYSDMAECPRFLAFLKKILPDPEVHDFVQRAVGYSLTGDTRERCLFIPYGDGANGKSTLLEIIRRLLGDYARQADISTFMLTRHDTGPRPEVVRLAGARFVSSIEVEENRRLAESLIKTLTGNDTITARGLYADMVEFQPTFKVWMATNHKPTIRGTDNAIWERIRLIPFNVTIPLDQRDGDLSEKLATELPGILAWAIRGGLAWQQHGLAAPKAVRVATKGYREEMDTVRRFLTDQCVEGATETVTAKDLYTAYKKWAEDGGERPMTQTRFGTRMSELGYRGELEGTTRRKMYVGIRLENTP